MHNIYSYLTQRHCILPSSEDNANDLFYRIQDIEPFLYRLKIYYSLIVFFMTPTLLLIYYIIFYFCKLFKWIYDKINICCIIYIGGQFHGVRNNSDSHYLDKSERGLLVEKLENSDCPICFLENTDLILTKGCKHGCCKECLYKYIITDLKNIGEYPRVCFMNDCNILLNYTNVEYVLTNENELEEYDRMLIMASTNGNNETIACPLCNAVMLKPRNLEDQGIVFIFIYHHSTIHIYIYIYIYEYIS